MSVSWKFVASITDGKYFEIEGLNIWDHKWNGTGRVAMVKDPLYRQERKFYEYEIISDGKTVRFAAGEFSNLVWGIYIPEEIGEN